MGSDVLRNARCTRIELEGRSLACVEYGDVNGPTLLCVHGWLDNAASFAPLAAALSGHRVLALELAGHGLSTQRAPGMAYHQIDWVIDVVEAAEALDLQRFALVGHSMGAGISVLAAATMPERVACLTLLEGFVPRTVAGEDVPAVLALHLEQKRKAGGQKQRTRPASMEVALRAKVAAAGVSYESAMLFAERGIEALPGGVVWRNDKRVQRIQPMTLSESAIRAFLRALQCPVLAITAHDGLKHDPLLFAERAACVPDFTRHDIPGRHHVHMDDAAQVAAIMEPFLARAFDKTRC